MKKILVTCLLLTVLCLVIEALCLAFIKTPQGPPMMIATIIFTTIDFVIIIWAIHKLNKETKTNES